MSLERYSGAAMPAIFATITAELGPDAVVALSRSAVEPDGRRRFDVLAGDSTAAERHLDRYRALAGHVALAMRPPLDFTPRSRPYTIVLVGPTGAGKTTTLAKLLGHPEVLAGARAAVLSMDTYRVGASEQLATYAELAGAEFDVIYDPGDLARAVRRRAGCDVMLVDTPGRSPVRAADTAQVNQRLHRLHPDEVHVVVPCGLHAALARRVVRAAVADGATHLLPTKLDECPGDTSLFDLAAELRLPMRWMTDGQEVPMDLKPAAPSLLLARALAGVGLDKEAA